MNPLLYRVLFKLSGICRSLMPEYQYVILRDWIFDILMPKERLYDQVRRYEQRYSSAFHTYLEGMDKGAKEQAMADLKRGLDPQSVQTIDRFLSFYGRIQKNPHLPHYERYDLSLKDDVATISKELSSIRGKLNPPPEMGLEYRMDCFYFQSGLRHVPGSIRERCTKGKDAIDCGAFNGDTALVFSKMTDARKVYAFEPDKTNFSNLLATLKSYPMDNVVPLPYGVGEKSGTVFLHAEGPSSFVDQGSAEGDRIDIKDIDSFVKKEGAMPGVIKMDIEGYEINAIRGALKTIKKHRPVLLIAIYHSPHDFFEIKPLLEKTVSGYRFMVRHLVFSHAAFETFLIAYPES